MSEDPRRRVPATDAVLSNSRVIGAALGLHARIVAATVRRVQQRVRVGGLAPDGVIEEVVSALSARESPPVLNATGVIVHTNLGRSPLGDGARQALEDVSGYAAVEYAVGSGSRGPRGSTVSQDLLDRVPGAEDALVVNNGAAALLLAVLALPGEVLLARGEMVEIGDGFRLHEMMAGAGRPVSEVGAANRVHVRDYAAAITEDTGCVLKVHPSNYRLQGYTSTVGVPELAALEVPVVIDLGSGLLEPHSALPDEPDARTALAQGAALVTFSTDKLLGGPQGGVVLGRADLVQRARRHPLARAMRADKLTLVSLSATLRSAQEPPTQQMLALGISDLEPRLIRLRDVAGGELVEADSVIGGGGAPGVVIPSLALAFPEVVARHLRHGLPVVIARVHRGRCLVDLRCIPEHEDRALAAALKSAVAL